MRVSFPQSSIFGWVGLIMSRAMYGLLRTSPFRIPTDPGPLAIYYPPRVAIVDTQGDPVLDGQGMPTYQAQPAIGRAEQATINARLKCAKNYWELYQNIRRAVFNCLDNGVNDAFKVSNNPALAGWNPLMEPKEMFDRITQHTGAPPLQPYYRTIHCFEACIPPKMPLRCYSIASKIAKRYRSSGRIPTWRSSCSITLSAFSCKPDYTPVILKIGIARSQRISYG